MNTKGLAKMYDLLTPRERMPLIIAAMDRGDRAEAERLAKSAPWTSHQLKDYHGLGEGLILLSLFQALGLLERAANFWLAISRMDDQADLFADEKDLPPKARRLQAVARLWAYLFTVEADAWKRLMEEMNIDPDTLLRDLPCYEAMLGHGEAMHLAAFTEEEARAYLRKTDKEAQPVTVESELAAMRTFLDRRVAWWA